MRTYFKNDLFHYTGQLEHEKSRKKIAIANQATTHRNQKEEKSEEEAVIGVNGFNVEHALKIEVCGRKEEIDIDEELREIFKGMKSAKKGQNDGQKKEMPVKLPFFTPKSTLKIVQKKSQEDIERQKQQEKKKQEGKVKSQFEIERRQKWENWKLRKDLEKVMKIQQSPKPKKKDNEGQEKEENSQEKQQKQKQEAQQNKQSDSQQQPQKPKAKTGKKKKIKKQANYVKTDLKRKYRDRFVGGINKNLRMLTRGGKMKRSYHRQGVNTELQLEEGELYNSYVISLSKALFVRISLEDSDDQSVQEKPLQYTIPETYEKEKLQKLIKELFGFDSFREGQYETTLNILQGKSTFFISETASGKSLTYLLASVILKGLSIVVSPLVSLMLDQIDHLPADLPAACISSLLNHEQKDRIIKMVKDGKIQILYITPESFLTDFMYHVRQFPAINFVCIDEAHSMSELSHSFRASYLSLQDIILKYFRYKTTHPVVLCLTATANTETVDSVSQKLNIKEVIRSNSVINKNLFVTISREYLTGKYEGLVHYLNHPQIRKCKGILVYCRTKKIMYDVFNYLRNSSLLCFIYHSGLPQKQKVETLEKFRKGIIRIVVATVALGMGLDFENLECVVHINMPKSVENYIQQIGRAGRRQKRAYCHLFLDKYDYFTERNYFLADQLEPKMFKEIIEILRTNFLENRRRGKFNAKIDDKKEKKDEKDGTQKLKRLSLQQKDDEQMDKMDDIYQQSQKIGQSKSQKIDSKNRRSQQQQQQNQQNNQKQADQDELANINEQDLQYLPLSYCKADYITQKVGLKQQAILNILLKIQKNLGRKTFKVLPMSYQNLKLSFFKKNQQSLHKDSQFYRTLTTNCKTIKGSIYIPLILKCNQLKLSPIRLLTQLHGLSTQYTLKIELTNEVFVWQHQRGPEYTFGKLDEKDIFDTIMGEFNLVQRTALTKFNIFYSLCFNCSAKSVLHILDKGGIVGDKEGLPAGGVMEKFDEYFKHETYEFYAQIVKEGQPESRGMQEQKQGEAADNTLPTPKQQPQQSPYLPITSITPQDSVHLKHSIQLFLKHTLLNNPSTKFIPALAPYRDGRTITRIFMGVNDTNSNWKTYGEHPYWMKFVDKDYRELVRAVRGLVTEYVMEEGPRMLELEGRGVGGASVSINVRKGKNDEKEGKDGKGVKEKEQKQKQQKQKEKQEQSNQNMSSSQSKTVNKE